MNQESHSIPVRVRGRASNPSYRVHRCSPIYSKTHRGQLLWADAFYCRDLLQQEIEGKSQSSERILKLACIADALQFTDYALELLEYLTLNHGKDSTYNFADQILGSLAQVPSLAEQGLDSLPIFTRLQDYVKAHELK